ncbi:MAG: patatin-like phospholipase family protein [Solirubrobacterales bacterium]|nr:patatin-like phospholipase family protein [Solirubrobacterales bacterium]
MLQALLERGILPDVVLGTSIGAINGAAVAAEPSPRAVQRLAESWSQFEGRDVFGGSALRRLGTLARGPRRRRGRARARRLLGRPARGVVRPACRQVIDVRLWHVPAEAVPRERAAQIDWLLQRWRAMDAWVGEQGSGARRRGRRP